MTPQHGTVALGVAGGSGSGKTSVACAIRDAVDTRLLGS